MPTRLGLELEGERGIVMELGADAPWAPVLLERLPHAGVLLHSRRSGCELFLALPPQVPGGLGLEDVSTIVPGDVIAHSFPPHYRDAPPAAVVDPSRGYLHVGIVYDRGARFATPAGYADVSVIGRVVSDLDGLRRVGESMRLTGGRSFSLAELEEGP